MKENKELLKYLYQTTIMGVNSTTYLLEVLQNKDNKIKKAVEDELKEYKSLQQRVKDKLNELNEDESEISLMKNMMSYMGINKEVIKDNSDAAIADMLIQGLTMGVVESEKYINSFKEEVDKDILKITEDLKKFQQNSITKLKEFL